VSNIAVPCSAKYFEIKYKHQPNME